MLLATPCYKLPMTLTHTNTNTKTKTGETFSREKCVNVNMITFDNDKYKETDKMLKIPTRCYIFEKQDVQGI